MEKTRIISLVLTLVVLLGCFAGCGEIQSTDSTNGSSAPSTSQPNNGNVEIDPVAREAVIKTALAYLARGTRIQYDDSRMYSSQPSNAEVLYRWQHSVRLSPEAYTSQYIGYTNCAAFTYDVYLAALNYDIRAFTTAALAITTGDRCIYRYKPTGTETAEEMISIEKEFRRNLEAGDIIVVRYNGNKAGNGHAMLYVGSEVLENVDGYKGAAAEGTDESGNPKNEGYVYDIIHSTGSSFKYTEKMEKYEPYGTIQMTAVDALFDSNNSRYVFSKLQSITIVRPLATFDGEVPEHTLNRMQYMDNVIAEKLSSHVAGATVNPGEEMTFTFSVTNKNEQEITLPVTDVIPSNTTFVFSDNCTQNGASLSWMMTIPAGKTQTVSYTVQVNEDARSGDTVGSAEGTVGGIPVNCPEIYIGRTLTRNEQQAIFSAVKSLQSSKLRGLELANAVYNALGTQDLIPNDYAVLTESIFKVEESYSYFAEDGTYTNWVAPGLFGGGLMIQRKNAGEAQLARYEEIRTRLLTKEQLVAGDLIIGDTDLAYENHMMYLYTGESLMDLSSGKILSAGQSAQVLTECLCYTRFAVLRPSLAMEGGE